MEHDVPGHRITHVRFRRPRVEVSRPEIHQSQLLGSQTPGIIRRYLLLGFLGIFLALEQSQTPSDTLRLHEPLLWTFLVT